MTFKKVAAFSDIGKAAKDLLYGGKEGLYTTSNSFTITTKTPDGVEFQVTSIKKSDADVIDSAIKISQKIGNLGGSLSVGSSGKLVSSLVFSNLVPNLTLALSGTTPDLSSYVLGADYALPYLTLKSSVGLNSTPKVDVTASTGYERFVLGGSASYDSQKSAVQKWSAGVGYTGSDFQLGLTTDTGKTVRAVFAHNYSPTQVIGGEVQFDVAKKASTAFSVGYSQRLDTGSLFKAKLDNDGLATVLYETELKPKVKTALTGAIDIVKLDKAPKVGITVSATN